jgi:uncharacterized protein YjbI with pentapeptide repeats
MPPNTVAARVAYHWRVATKDKSAFWVYIGGICASHRRASLTGVRLYRRASQACILGVYLSQACILCVRLIGAYLSQTCISYRRASLTGGHFLPAGISYRRASYRRAFLTGVHITGVHITGVHITGVHLLETYIL